jgi:cytoskeletal protein CcmA (bactofilin family)
MSDTQLNRRLADRRNGTPTVIGEGAQFRGDINTSGSVLLSGAVRGDGEIRGTLSIARGAHWDGKVHARSAVIAGELTGSITVDEQLEVGAAAVIRGQVTARSLAIARGAIIEGDLQVTSGEPIVRFEEKRGAESA